MAQWKRVSVIAACSLAAALPSAAGADALTWRQVYRCSLYAGSVAEYLMDVGRSGADFDAEFDALVAAALKLHATEYSRRQPSATRDALVRAWETDTAREDDAFLKDVDASPSAVEFLRSGYQGCGAERSYALLRKLGGATKD